MYTWIIPANKLVFVFPCLNLSFVTGIGSQLRAHGQPSSSSVNRMLSEATGPETGSVFLWLILPSCVSVTVLIRKCLHWTTGPQRRETHRTDLGHKQSLRLLLLGPAWNRGLQADLQTAGGPVIPLGTEVCYAIAIAEADWIY